MSQQGAPIQGTPYHLLNSAPLDFGVSPGGGFPIHARAASSQPGGSLSCNCDHCDPHRTDADTKCHVPVPLSGGDDVATEGIVLRLDARYES